MSYHHGHILYILINLDALNVKLRWKWLIYTNHPLTYIDFPVTLYVNKIAINSSMKKSKIIYKYYEECFYKLRGLASLLWRQKKILLQTVQKQDVYNKNINAIFLYTFTYKC